MRKVIRGDKRGEGLDPVEVAPAVLRVLTGAEIGDRHLHEVSALSQDLVGEVLPSEDVLRRRLSPDPQCLMAVALATSEPSIVAYSVVYGLDVRTTEAVERLTIRRGADLPADGIRGDDPASLYIGMIAGCDHVLALRLLATHLLRRWAAAPWADKIFTRPATDAGRRLVRRAGFCPLGASSEIWGKVVAPLGTSGIDDHEGEAPLITRSATNAAWMAVKSNTQGR